MSTTNLPARKPETVAALINDDGFVSSIAAAFGGKATATEVKNALVLASQKSPALLKCTPASFAKTVRDSATIGLLPNGRDAHLVPFGTDITLVPDYKGLVKLALASGKVLSIRAACVYSNDDYAQGFTSEGETFRHFPPAGFAERGDLLGVYCRVKMENGEVYHEAMGKSDVDKIRAKSKGANAGPWRDHYDEMAKKTVTKRTMKWLPVTPELAAALEKDDEGFVEIDAAPARPARRGPRLDFPGGEEPSDSGETPGAGEAGEGKGGE